jgi:serine/threonine protein kinase
MMKMFPSCTPTLYGYDWSGIIIMERGHPLPNYTDFEHFFLHAVQMISIVYTIHMKHVIHGDIKPQNWVITGGAPRIIDFGISQMFKSKLSPYITTANYRAPEGNGEDYDEKIDIYSLGRTFKEMLGKIRPPSAFRHTLQLMLQKDPKKRIGSDQLMKRIMGLDNPIKPQIPLNPSEEFILYVTKRDPELVELAEFIDLSEWQNLPSHKPSLVLEAAYVKLRVLYDRYSFDASEINVKCLKLL